MNGITAPILNTVTAPLVLGDWGTNVYNYQQFYVTMVNSVLEESELLVTDKFLEEMSKQFYGNETAKTVISLFESSELTKKGEIDDNCAAVINELIALINQYLHTKKVSGRILNENGNGVQDSFVSVYFEDINGDTLIEATNTDEKGNYAVSYSVLSPEIPEEELSELGHKVGNLTFPPIKTGTRGIKVIAKDASETYEVSSDIFFETSNNLTIDLTLPFKADDSVPDEMTLLEKKIIPLLAERTEPEDDSVPLNLIHFIAKALSEDETIVRYYVLSNNYSVKVDDINMKPLLYGIMRGSNISSIEAIANLHNEQLLEYTKHAVNKNWIPNISNESIINEIIDEFKNSSTTFILDTKTETPENSKAYKILSYVFSDSLITEFLDYYYAQLPDGNFDFWKDDELVTNLPNFTSGDISSLKSIFTCALLSGSNPKLSNIFYTEGTEDFAGLSEEEWITFLEDQLTYEDPYFIIPDFIEGELPEDKVANYAAYLKLNVDGVFPTTAVKQQILKDTDDTFAYIAENINTFVENNSGFDILKTPLQYLTADDTEFDFTDIEDKEDFLEELASLQRLNAVYSSYDMIKVLYSNNLKSAMDIISMPLDEFEALFEDPEEEMLERSSLTPFSSTYPSANLIYQNALGTVMYVQAVAMQFHSIYAEYNWNSVLGFDVTPEVQAEWRSLFGNVDFCNCEHCLSIFSPSAYLADMLNYLKQVSDTAYQWLAEKRPDIPKLLLTCKNTNVALPTIDLVNELLEDIVINDDASSVNFPLQIEAHNTQLDEKTLRSVPEYINIDGKINNTLVGEDPYTVLRKAVYPWSAPYDYYQQQVVHYLDVVNLKAYDFVETYTDTQANIAENTINWACVYLGITKDNYLSATTGEYLIITDLGTDNVRRRKLYGLRRSYSSGGSAPYYIPNPADRTDLLLVPDDNDPLIPNQPLEAGRFSMQRMDIMMQQAGLSYQDILELLDCYYINPFTAPGTRRLFISSSDESSCNLTKTKIDGLEETDLDKILRFVRLKRRCGFSFYELDQVLTMLGVTAGAVFTDHIIITVAQVKRLKEILGCKVEDLLPFWGDIAYQPYSKYTVDNPQRLMTQYEKYFRNQVVVPNFDQIEDYPFPADMEDWLAASAVNMTSNTLKYILAAFQIDEKNFDYLSTFFYNDVNLRPFFTFSSPGNKIRFSYANVRQLYREFFFAKFLKISIVDWCYMRSWMMKSRPPIFPAVNPFDFNIGDSHLTNTFHFIAAVKVFRNSKQTAALNDFLFYDKASTKDKEAVLKTIDAQYYALQQLLQKQNASIINEEGVVDSVLLYNKLKLIFNDADTDFLIEYIAKLNGHTAPPPFAFSTQDRLKLQNLMPGFMSMTTIEGYLKQLVGVPTSEPYTLEDIDDRLELLNTIFIKEIYKSVVRSYLATTYNIDLTITNALLEKWITVVVRNESGLIINRRHGYEILIAQEYIDALAAAPRLDNVSIILLRFYKAAALIVSNSLSLEEVNFFLKAENRVNLAICDFSELPVSETLDITYPVYEMFRRDWYNLLHWFHTRELFYRSPTSLVNILSNVFKLVAPSAEDVKLTWFNAIKFAIQSSEEDLTVLIGAKDDPDDHGILNFNFSGIFTSYKRPDNYFKLFRCYDIKSRLEVNMQSCKDITYDSILRTIVHTGLDGDIWQLSADFVVNAVKAKYDNNDWLDVCLPVNDMLRTGRRDALLNYLLVNPPKVYARSWYTSADIYETLMIDPEVMPIVSTSRIKQAISSVQVFIERCILQKEYILFRNNTILLTPELVTLDSIFISQWQNWRKWYRIWEANRKIFVYPQNWIEPELRDNKSPFFKELEKFTKQNEITMDTMETAYRTYLERLQSISDLDIVAHLTDTVRQGNRVIDEIVHVWGRTRSTPAIYYHRYRKEGVWTAWEKMETQIDGDKFTAVKYKGRIRLFWITFMAQDMMNKSNKPDANGEMEMSDRYHKIELNWTEYKDGRWQPRQIGRQAVHSPKIAAITTNGIAFNYGVMTNQFSHSPNDWTRYTDFYTKEAVEHCFDYMKTNAMIYSHVKVQNVGITSEETLEIHVIFYKKNIKMSDIISYVSSNNDDQRRFLWTNGLAYYGYDAETQQGSIYTAATNAYHNTQLLEYKMGRFTFKNENVVVDYPDNFTFYGELSNNRARYSLINNNSDYIYNVDFRDGFKHPTLNPAPNNFAQLLWLSPGFENAPSPDKYVLYPRNLTGYGGPIEMPKFFYKDYKSLFLVEKVMVPFTVMTAEADLGTVNAPVNPTLNPAASQFLLADARLSTTLSGISFSLGAQNVNTPATPPVSSMQLQASTLSLGSFNNLSPALAAQYRFTSFNYTCIEELLDNLDRGGVAGLLDRVNQNILSEQDKIDFENVYWPYRVNVIKYKPYARTTPENIIYPKGNLIFDYDDPNSIYNWELFYHIPMYIATRLMQDQKFAEAMQWFHFIFNPSNTDTTLDPLNTERRFWNYYPFRKAETPSLDAVLSDNNLLQAVQRWANNPFKPHVVAQTRISAYMQNTVMKYLDNLIEWGDQLFRRDTAEAINEAVILYMSAAQLLGRAPVKIPARVSAAPHSFSDLQLNAFSNAMVPIETRLAPTGMTAAVSNTPSQNAQLISYFCIPQNEKLLEYWDVVADRLFKIRNSQNIDGVERILALFEPPIDPAMLVKAAASGMSISDAVSDLYAPMPQYRFSIMVQKAAEIAQEVKGLGASLLAALEKKDAEYLANLRSTQELAVLQAGKDIKVQQVKEAEVQVAALMDQKQSAEIRKAYYDNLIDTGWNSYEQTQLDNMQSGIPLKETAVELQSSANVLGAIPQLKVAAPTSAGVEAGGLNALGIINAIAGKINGYATTLDIKGSMAGIKGGYARREQEWKFQQKLAVNELKQVDKQILAAEIRKSIADYELKNYELQITNSIAVNEAMQSKFTNEELYDWMIGEISMSYFQMYKLAFDIARKAERTYNFELGRQNNPASFIQFGYWDSLKKGLLAGERLILDIKRMDTAFLDNNTRMLEMTRNVSLAAFAPELLVQLKNTSKVNITFPEWLFDMENPGQYMRRIKSVSISIPCIAGPYTTITAQLNLISSQYRFKTTGDYPVADNDTRFVSLTGGGQSIATSSAQNDSGLFELNFKDERYLPFEGAGLISTWALSLPARYASYDINSIKDVIFHFKYTAKYDGGLAAKANDALAELFSDEEESVLLRGLSLNREFSNEWRLYASRWPGNHTALMEFVTGKNRFPLYFGNIPVTIHKIEFCIKALKDLPDNPKLQLWVNNEEEPVILSIVADQNYGLKATYVCDFEDIGTTGPLFKLALIQEGTPDSYYNISEYCSDIQLLLHYTAGTPDAD